MQKTYLSRAVTRAMSLDHPVGDPFGGPAYGEKNDPVSAIISIGTMAGTYAAAGTFAAMTLTQGLMFAGAALSLAGNITGNKTLMKIGMITGLAGGVGALAEMATGTTFGGTLGETFGFGEAAGTGLSQTPVTGVGPQTPVVDGQIVDTAASPMAELSSPSASFAGENLNTPGGAGLNTPGGALTPLSAPTTSLTASPTGVDYSLLGADGGASVSMSGGGTGFQTGGSGADALYKVGNATKPGMMASGLQFVKDNPLAAMMGFQAMGGLSDYLSGVSDAEIDALKAQVGYADARALQIQEAIALEKQRRLNLNQGYQQVDASLPTNPNAGVQPPWQQQPAPGLIANNMPRS